MADPISLDTMTVTLGGTDISQWVAQADLTVMHVETGVPITLGNLGPRRRVSAKYDWTLMLDLVSDGWDSGDLDYIVSQLMPPPLGPANGTGIGVVTAKPMSGVTAVSNPLLTMSIAIAQWKPFGAGTPGEIVRQTQTFNGTSDIVKATT